MKNPQSKDARVGTLHAHDSLFFRVHVGEAKFGDHKYELSINAGNSTPIVRSLQPNGGWFTLNWQHVLEMAIAAGIDNPAKLPQSNRKAA